MEISEIIPILATTPTRWSSLVSALPVELANRKPAPGEWSAVECLLHIIDVEQVFNTRLQAFLAGRDFPGFNPDPEGTQARPALTETKLAANFARMRQDSLAALAKLTPADLDRKALHAELGPVTLRQLMAEWVAHDLNHTVQAEQALMQPFITACGPWGIYFQDHLAR